MKISGRTFVITGGCNGLGLATTQELAAAGASIACLDLKKPETPLPPSAIWISCDVTSTASIAATIPQVKAFIAQTEHPIGGIIPAAGVGFSGLMRNYKGKPLDIELAKLTIDVNFTGTLDTIRQYLSLLIEAPREGEDGERGVIVMVASSSAYDGQRGQVVYSGTKGAIRSMTLPMARDLSEHGIRVVSVAPSLFDTAMGRSISAKTQESLKRSMEFPNRAGKAPEFARLVRAILENVMLNGEVIRLDGAMRLPSKL